MVKVTSFSRVAVGPRKVSKAFFRTRLHVSCNFEFPPEMGRVAIAKRMRTALEAAAAEMGLEPGTEFYFSKFSGRANAGWGDGAGFILSKAAPGEPCTIYVTMEQSEG